MKVKELIDLLQKFPPDYDVIYDTQNQLLNDGYHVEITETNPVLREEVGWNTEFDGEIEDFYISSEPDIKLVCLTAKAKPNETEGG